MPNSCRPAGLVARVEPAGRPADKLELLCRLQLHGRRHGLGERSNGQFTVGCPATIRGEHSTPFCLQLRRRQPEALRRGAHQHRTHARADLAVLLPRVVHGGRAADNLGLLDRVLVCLARRCQLAAHRAPVGIHLFGHQHRQRRVHALPDVDFADGDRHRAVGIDADEGRWLLVGLQGAVANFRLSADRIRAQRKARPCADLEERATVYAAGRLLHESHGTSFRQSPSPHPSRRHGYARRCRNGRGWRSSRGRCRRRSAACWP
jgi:hypothetical protein